jgi:hypothetical protein
VDIKKLYPPPNTGKNGLFQSVSMGFKPGLIFISGIGNKTQFFGKL